MASGAGVAVLPQRPALLAAIDAGAVGFTLFEIGQGVRLATPPVAGIAAFLVLNGTLRLHTDVGDVPVRAGQLALVPAGRTSALAAPGGVATDPVVDGTTVVTRRGGWLVADARRDGTTAVTVAAGRIGGTTNATLALPLVLNLAGDRCARQTLALLRGEIATPRTGSIALAEAMLGACIVYAIRAAGHDTQVTTRDGPGSLASVVAAITARPGAPHSVESLADIAGMGRSTFTRKFAATYAMGPMEFVLTQRLGEAATLLRSTDLPVKAVAGEVGFVSRSYFSRAFRARFGVDPSAYRTQG